MTDSRAQRAMHLPSDGQGKVAKNPSSHLGVEPRTFGLEVQRAIHCANGTQDTNWLLKMVLFQNAEKVSARIEYH